MKTLSLPRLLAVAVVAATAAWALAQTAHAGPAAPQVPSVLEVPAGNKLFLTAHAEGVQSYVCNAAAGVYRWDFVAPRADLYGRNGKLLATHFGGPTWLARDGSSVVGRVAERSPAPNGAIPWLLLEAASTSAGADGDRLAGTTYIQRLATTGGVAPAPETCGAANVGVTQEVPYTADYTFWKGLGD